MGEKFLFWLVMILGVGGFVLVSLESCNDSQAKRLYAEAALTGAKSAARQDLLAGLMPYTVLGISIIVIVLVISLVIFGLIHLANIRASQPRPQPVKQLPPPQVTHVHNNYFLVAGDIDFDSLSDRQVLKRLTEGRVIRRGE
jgi:hypothetical protein